MIFKELNKPYIIAEIGCNHNGNTELGLKMIKSAKDCGADAVKFQYFTKENLFTEQYMSDLDEGSVKIENIDKWETKELNLDGVSEQIDEFINDKEQLGVFKKYCDDIGIDFGCTPVDADGVYFLKEINSSFIKLASMDADNLEMIEAAIDTGLPILISTGMADLQEIDAVYNLFKSKKFDNFSLLHTVSIYPPRDEIVNLNFIDTLNALYDCEIGYSDHTLGFSVPLAAIGKGVKVIEKHFTLDKEMFGWDHKVSADEKDLKIICEEGNKVYRTLGSSYKVLSPEEIEKREKFRRSATLNVDVRKGHVLTKEDFVYKRPGTGIRPGEIDYVLGRKFKNDTKKDKTLLLSDFD
ncbi:MAG: N-acetylneuraminate synthase [endosymbiont of Galathealinum brachiosum]|uniref:N-acetylneuraminate synthase n=1 Tax=endosymbiont of Galathealinum brachiosum TaxID=2200906 RepID=A0A370DAV6_9GAMM|nr:MAG: N-acetylneuraminate synthase [endosymbiont of Galathealinum brachiosum]